MTDEALDFYNSIPVKELEARANSGECLGSLEYAHAAAVNLTLDIVAQFDTREAQRIIKQLTPKESDTELMHRGRFVGMVALLIPRRGAEEPSLDGSNPHHFPIAIGQVCTKAVESAGDMSKSMQRNVKRAIAIAQIAVNYELIESQAAIQ